MALETVVRQWLNPPKGVFGMLLSENLPDQKGRMGGLRERCRLVKPRRAGIQVPPNRIVRKISRPGPEAVTPPTLRNRWAAQTALA